MAAALCALIVLCAGLVEAAQATLPPHPRIRLTTTKVDDLRTVLQSDPRAKELWANLTEHSDYILAQPLPANGSGLLCDVIRDHMYTFGLLYHVTTNSTIRTALATRATQELLLVSKESSWSPRRFLTVAETMHGVAVGYDWFFDELSLADRETIEDALVLQGLNVGLACWAQNCSWTPGIANTGSCTSCWWTQAPMNWNIVSNGGLAIAALAIADVPRHAAVAEQALRKSAQGIPIAIAKYSSHFAGPDGRGDGGHPAADGAWPEGPGYWSYVTKSLVAVSESLATSLGSDNGYMDMPGVSQTVGFGLQTHFTPSRAVFNFGDAEEERPFTDGVYGVSTGYQARYSANLLGLSKRFPEFGLAPAVVARETLATPAADENGAWDDIVLALLAWDTKGSQSDIAALTTAAFYPAHAVAAFRSGWGDSDSYLGCKGGDSMATHQDLDHGSFVWETTGYRWTVDLGSEVYQLHNMFLPFEGRYTYYRKSTRGHNTITFGDPGGVAPSTASQSDQKVNIFSSLTPGPACHGGNATGCQAGVVAIVNLTAAYTPQLDGARVERSFGVDFNAVSNTLVVEDSIGNNPSELNVTWAIHTRASVWVNETEAVLRGDGGRTMQMSFQSQPDAVCGPWQTAVVALPPDRFPINVRKVWVVCQSSLRNLRVTLASASK